MVPVPDILVHTPNYLRSNYIILLFRESWRWSEISQDNPTLLIMFIVFSFFLCLASRNTKGRQGGAFRTICCSTRMDATKYGMLLFFFFMWLRVSHCHSNQYCLLHPLLQSFQADPRAACHPKVPYAKNVPVHTSIRQEVVRRLGAIKSSRNDNSNTIDAQGRYIASTMQPSPWLGFYFQHPQTQPHHTIASAVFG